jgi:hypothetical protein
METLAHGSTIRNPAQDPPREHLGLGPAVQAPSLARGVDAAPTTADALFDVQLDALVTGWTEIAGRS